MAIVVPLPEPINQAEAYYVVMVVDSPGMAAGHIRQLRYFVLEYLRPAEASAKPTCRSGVPKEPTSLNIKFTSKMFRPRCPHCWRKLNSVSRKVTAVIEGAHSRHETLL